MGSFEDVLRYDEKAVMSLRALYRQYGYTQYRMSRFEEYGLYADNKSFLASGEIITFTGGGGRLLALRPDVTLSIVKNTNDSDGLRKLYYNENVYRPGGVSREFKERPQTGVECIGDIDAYQMGEVIMLAVRSMETLAGSVCLDISHMGCISGLLESAENGLTDALRLALLRCVSEKNVPELLAVCSEHGIETALSEKLARLAALYGTYAELSEQLRHMCVNRKMETALLELEAVCKSAAEHDAADCIKLDFSIVNDLNYYSGIIFQGFIEGVPYKVLSGGRYDELLRKFGKSSGAIGFALYLDLLERLAPPRGGLDVDILLLYGADVNADELSRTVKTLRREGNSVRVQKTDGGGIKYGRLMQINAGGGLETLEKNC